MYVFSTRNEDNRAARDGKLEVAPELPRPRFQLLIKLPDNRLSAS